MSAEGRCRKVGRISGTLSLPLLVALAAIFLLAGLVKGVVGLGLPTVAMGLLSLAVPPAQAAALLVVPSLATNLWQMAAGPRLGPLLRRLWPMMLGVVVGTCAPLAADAALLTRAEAAHAAAALGLALVVYAALGLAAVRMPAPGHAEPWLSTAVGAATGIVTAATGVFVVPAVPYLAALGLEKEELVQALGLSFTVSTLALALGLAGGGVFQAPLLGASLLALAPALAGMAAGQWIRTRVSAAVFRRCFFLGLLALGVHLALRVLL